MLNFQNKNTLKPVEAEVKFSTLNTNIDKITLKSNNKVELKRL